MVNKSITDHETLKVSGNIIKEVSEKLPNMFIALNELIKNSYDACAMNVEILFSYDAKYLIIKDDGVGMDKSAISTLLSLASSTKKYGHVNECGRITQGSKGLGFLSVFKFGQIVSWETVNGNEKRELRLDIRELQKDIDISKRQLPIIVTYLEEEISSYTLIKIEMNSDTISEFTETFVNSKEGSQRIINAFIDEGFKIKFNINNKTLLESQPRKMINPLFNERVLYNVEYDSNTQSIQFLNNQELLFSVKYPTKTKRFTIDMKLEIYDLKGMSVTDSDPLFIYRSTNQRILAPAVYINKNLFHSHELFDPSITRPIKSSIVLPQIAGFINIYSTDSEIEFNSERTKLVDNSFSLELKEFLQKINILIQTEGSKNKFGLINRAQIIAKVPLLMAPLPGDNYEINLNKIKDHCISQKFKFKSLITAIIKDNNIEFFFVKKSLGIFQLPKLFKDMIFPVEIVLKKDFINLKAPNSQLDLKSFLVYATNSKKENVTKDVRIFVDDIENTQGILGIYEDDREISVNYIYHDSNTGKSISTLKILLVKDKNNVLSAAEGIPYFIPAFHSNDYLIGFNYYVSTLVNQMNKLHQMTGSNIKEYDILYASSMRLCFDLSINELIKACIKPNQIKYTNTIEVNVNNVIRLLDKDIRVEIARKTGNKIDVLNSLLLVDNGTSFTTSFGNAARLSNLATHTANQHILPNDILDISNKIAWFLLFVNEIITNSAINSRLK